MKTLSYFSLLAVASSVFCEMPVAPITPSAQPKVENAIDAAFSIDFIYWNIRKTNQAYAINSAFLFDPVGFPEYAQPVGHGHTYYPAYSYEPGFKLGLGLDFEHDDWDLFTRYTRLHTPKLNSNVSVYGDIGENELNYTAGINSFNFIVDGLTTGGALDFNGFNHSQYKFDIIDLELGRNYHLSEFFIVRPSFGLKAAWTKSNWFSSFNTFFNQAGTVENLTHTSFVENNFNIGIRSALETTKVIYQGFSLYSHAAFSVLNASQKIHYKTRVISTEEDVTDATNYKNLTLNQNYLAPVVELGLGFAYNTLFNNDKYRIGLAAGWEFQYWNGNDYLYPLSNQATSSIPQNFSLGQGTFSIQGLDISLKLDF